MIVVIIFFIIVMLFAIYLIVFGKFEGNPYHISFAIALFGVAAMGLGSAINELSRKRFVIEKSNDSNWTYSANQKIERDTTITEAKLFIKGTDTIITLPTVEYKVIKKK